MSGHIIYHPRYNISLCGLEKFHPFDTYKYAHIVQYLKDRGVITDGDLLRPKQASQQDLRSVHSCGYLCCLCCPCRFAKLTEVPAACLCCWCCYDPMVLAPMRFATGGTLLGGRIALDTGWAINLSGGYHHASGTHGGGFCIYADISIVIRTLLNEKKIHKALIIDLDAHQGNGPERDFLGDPNIHIFDLYNGSIYPKDRYAKQAIKTRVELQSGTRDKRYLDILRTTLPEVFAEARPDFVVYNAGTDIFEGDSLGALGVSDEGIIARDDIVFREALDRRTPIVMVLSGGYTKESAMIVGRSIENLLSKIRDRDQRLGPAPASLPLSQPDPAPLMVAPPVRK